MANFHCEVPLNVSHDVVSWRPASLLAASYHWNHSTETLAVLLWCGFDYVITVETSKVKYCYLKLYKEIPEMISLTWLLKSGGNHEKNKSPIFLIYGTSLTQLMAVIPAHLNSLQCPHLHICTCSCWPVAVESLVSLKLSAQLQECVVVFSVCASGANLRLLFSLESFSLQMLPEMRKIIGQMTYN